ncbi:putative phage recombinase [Piscinibacter sakaiensis]|uniref:Putative phage recombinase n=1 Tax=Piscinibacter sakaiensis TaxID=1547922 RepID=A0A0K8P801_PISS1|nr:putative phage recombinase [Piscinibacter sakaiensis]
MFLAAIEAGRIVPGSVLVVEGLDHLSRAEPLQAQAQLAQIVNAGITVVTASDGKAYSREHLKATPMDLVYSLLVMIRAHEESDTKSKRVLASIRRQCQGWLDGTWRGVIRNGKDPARVRRVDGERHLIPERVEAVRTGLELYRRGYGAQRIVQTPHDGPSSFCVETPPTILTGRRARWACGQAAGRPVHMSTGLVSQRGNR